MDVAVTGAGTPIGRLVLPALVAAPDVDRVLALDATPVAVPAGVAAGGVDPRDPGLGDHLAGIDVLVHLGLGDDPRASDTTMLDRNLAGTRRALEAAVGAGATRIVVVTAASVYGAGEDNDVPLTESSPRRAPVDAPGVRHVAAVEDWLWDWATTLPAMTTVTVLRPVTTVGGGLDAPLRALVGLPRIPVVAGHAPPVQVLHGDDLVAAVVHAASRDLPGAFNVGSPGWLSIGEAAAVVGRRTVPVPEEVARGAADALWRSGATGARSSRVDYMMHPWVVDVHRLEATGWRATHSNRDALAALADEETAYMRVAGRRVRRDRAVLGVLVASGAWAAVVAALLRWVRR